MEKEKSEQEKTEQKSKTITEDSKNETTMHTIIFTRESVRNNLDTYIKPVLANILSKHFADLAADKIKPILHGAFMILQLLSYFYLLIKTI